MPSQHAVANAVKHAAKLGAKLVEEDCVAARTGVVITACVGGSGLACIFVWWAKGKSVLDRALMLLLLGMFSSLLQYSIVIPESNDVAESVGRHAAFSGKVIGAYFVGHIISMVSWYIFSKINPDGWLNYGKPLVAVSLLVNSAGAWCYSYLVVTRSVTPQVIAALLMSVRVLSGIGSGSFLFMNQICVITLVSRAEITGKMANFYLASVMGIGMGPLIAAGMREFGESIGHCSSSLFELSPMISAVLSTVICVLVLCRYPDLAETPASSMDTARAYRYSETPSRELLELSDPEAPLKKYSLSALVFFCILLDSVRSSVVSGLEAATAQLLQHPYGYSRRSLGTIVGCSFLVLIPAKFGHGALSWALKEATWIRLTAYVALVGAALLLHNVCDVLHLPDRGLCPAMLILGSTILYPCLYLSSVLVVSIMVRNVSQSNTMAASTVTVCNVVARESGRALGPVIARFQVAQGGQDYYAMQQIALCMLFVVVFECYLVFWTE